ncbi:hypothetical protein AWC38_SpisGene16586 [Stylophora pistillata]|uniref:Uncharacterized protein n=1 Tax=Stylophora pistillata TaxID=50429 RepID=A0A2B4RN33_STYPI|nr:hypothetical protein AWC38_SpisGene16586 [Stylophora pistillata]
MLYADDFEEELREEYGKIFHNIAYIRARKLGDRENNPRKDKKEDILSQATSYEKRYEEDIELRRDKWPVQGANRWESDIMSDGVNTKPLSPKAQSAKDTGPWEGESQTFQSDPSLYEKVAQDLETVFSRCAMVNPTVNSFRTEGMEVALQQEGFFACAKVRPLKQHQLVRGLVLTLVPDPRQPYPPLVSNLPMDEDTHVLWR